MQEQRAREFQVRFRRWLGAEPEKAARIVARLSGYSIDYVRWVAGLIGKKQWPGSDRFVERMEGLGCSDKPWHDRSAEELQRAFVHREILQEGSSGD